MLLSPKLYKAAKKNYRVARLLLALDTGGFPNKPCSAVVSWTQENCAECRQVGRDFEPAVYEVCNVEPRGLILRVPSGREMLIRWAFIERIV